MKCNVLACLRMWQPPYWKLYDEVTAWKVSKCGVFCGSYFPMFGLYMEIYSINLRIQSEYRKIWTRKNPVFGHFSRSDCFSLSVIKFHIMWQTFRTTTRRFDRSYCKIRIIFQVIITLSNMEKVGYYCWWQFLVDLEHFCRKSLQLSSMYRDRSTFL